MGIMKEGLKDYVCEWEKELNLPLINKSADDSLVNYVKDVWKSLEVVEAIKIDSFEFNERESEIDVNKYIFKREKKKKKKDRVETKLIADTRCGLLTVNLTVTMLEKDSATGEQKYQVYPVKKSILIPIQDENGYFYIKGKSYYMIYQLLEASTYTSASSVTLKSLMPIAVKRIVDDFQDINGITHTLPCYNVYVFRKEIPVILFYLAHGIDFTLHYLDIYHIISFIDKLPAGAEEDNTYIYFQISSKCFLRVYRELFNKYPYIQAMVGSFCHVCTNRTTLHQLDNPREWIKKICVPANYEKGLSTVKYFNRMLDETTKKVLRIPDIYKEDIYSLIKWIIQNFNELRLKDNLDLNTKRLRCNEYIASLLTKEFSKRLNRIISLGEKATIDNILEVFKFPGDILIQKLHQSGVLRFDDSVNDMNFWSKVKFTNKGPNSLGGKNSNNIGIKYRGIHPSHLGQLDVLVCGD